MGRLRRRDDTFVELDYSYLWNNLPDDEWTILCLSRRDVNILLSENRFANWPTRWRIDDRNIRDLLLIDRATYQPIWDEISAYVAGLERRLMMDCSEALYAGLHEIALAIGNISCSQQVTVNPSTSINNYIQGYTQSGDVIYGSVPGKAVVENEPPEGFETWQDYLDHKCRASNWFLDGVVSALRNLAFLDIVSLVGGGATIGIIAGGLAGTFPPALLPALVIAVIACGALLYLIDSLGDWLETNREEVICELYHSSTATEAYEAFGTYIDEAIAALSIPAAVSPHIRTIALLLASTDTLNVLFDSSIAITYASADCSSCDEMDFTFEYIYGSGPAGGNLGDLPQEFVFEGEYLAQYGNTYLEVILHTPQNLGMSLTCTGNFQIGDQWQLINVYGPWGITSTQWPQVIGWSDGVHLRFDVGGNDPFTAEAVLSI